MSFYAHRFFFFLIFFLAGGTLFAMEGTGTKLLVKDREQAIIAAIKEIKPGGRVSVETPFISSLPIQKALLQARANKVNVEIHTTNRAKLKNRADLEKTGVEIKEVPGLHAKRVLLTDEIEEKDANGDMCKRQRCAVFFGSDNLTWVSPFHIEELIRNNNKDFYEKNRDTFSLTDHKKVTKKSVIQTTPEKPALFSSQDYRLNRSRVRRLDPLFKKTLTGHRNATALKSMTFDSEEVVHGIEKGFKQCKHDATPPLIELYFDASVEKHPDLLNRMKKAGGDNIKIYIYKKGKEEKIGKIPKLMHAKDMTRKIVRAKASGDIEENYFVGVFTGNLTEKSDEEINYDSYHPGDKALYDEITKVNNAIKLLCTEYQLPPESESDTSDTEDI